ncbi:MAG TPA: hypothetical protein DCY15_01625 [Ruminococcaceae bacterium]|nr:hypothetical protein [Oscillospiraceae bacterium]
MREILFRGKSIITNEWVYGGIIAPYGEEKYYIINNTSDLSELDADPVNPETVGQYTGITDRNGTKIFEGDIIQVDEIEDPTFLVAWNNDDAGFELVDDGFYLPLFGTISGQNIKVIGNIHDNPELLEVPE